jgi:hypothetical protein
MLLLLFCFSVTHAANEVSILERVLLEQEVVLANQKMSLKVSLTSRNIWQQQGLTLIIDIATAKPMPSLSAQLMMTGTQSWQALSMMLEPEQMVIDDIYHYRWKAIVFPKQLGVQDLPALRLRLEGASGAQKTLSLPSLSVYVRSLPIFVPAQAWVGKAEQAPVVQESPGWILVGDQQIKTWQWRVQGLLSQGVHIPVLSGSAITGLQPWLDVQHEWVDGQYWTTIHAQQPWAATDMGRWYVNTQDIWLFDGQTGKVQHWQVLGDSGFALAPWVWNILLAIATVIALFFVFILMRFVRCRLRRHHYQQGIARATDAEQLLSWLRLQWQLENGIPLAHQAQGLPIEAELVVLEGLLFSSQVLYKKVFGEIQQRVVTKSSPFHC